MTFVLRTTLAISLLMHLLLVSLITSRSGLIETASVSQGEASSPNLLASLRTGEQSVVPPASISHISATEQAKSGSVAANSGVRRKAASVRSTANSGKNSWRGDSLESIAAKAGSQDAVSDINEEIVTRYRLALAREIRLRKKGLLWEYDKLPGGEVLLSVNFGAKSGVPELMLVRSSGQDMLDQQVMVMVSKVLSDSPLPEYLKGRAFRMSLLVGSVVE